jgi:Fur family iron response transcriptional regulator
MDQTTVAQPSDDTLKARLRAAGVSPTRQRLEIARILFARDQHLSADQLLAQLRMRGRRAVSKATVYNTLGLFVDVGLVREVLADPSRVFYDSNTSEHHHIYDMDSGTLLDISPELMPVSAPPPLPADREVAGVEVVVRVRRPRS